MNGIGILSGACKCYVADRFASRQGCFCLFLLVFAADAAPFTCCGSGAVLLPLAAAVSGGFWVPAAGVLAVLRLLVVVAQLRAFWVLFSRPGYACSSQFWFLLERTFWC
jgi:hypothetical protein